MERNAHALFEYIGDADRRRKQVIYMYIQLQGKGSIVHCEINEYFFLLPSRCKKIVNLVESLAPESNKDRLRGEVHVL